MNLTQKISQMTPKGSDLQATDLVEVSTLVGGSYVTKSVTGQDIIDAAAGSGVTDVTGTLPIVSTGGTTPDISIRQSSSVDDGYLSASDWIVFNDKQDALVSGTNIKTINGSSVLGSGNLVVSGGGASGIHALVKPISGRRLTYALGSGNTGANFALSRLTLIPFFPANTFTISEILMYCNILGVGSLCRLLIYSDNNGVPDAKLYESADLNLSTIGFKIATTTFTFNAGTTYWLGFHSNATVANVTFNTAAVVYVIANAGTAVSPANGYNIAANLGSAPANINIASATLNTSNTPWIGLTPA